MSDHQPALVQSPEPSLADDLGQLAGILERAQLHGPRAIRPREIMVLTRVAKAFAPAEHVNRVRELPSVLSTPSCPDCGFAVEKRGELCAACKLKQGSRAKPLFEVGTQPQPKYAEESAVVRDADVQPGGRL